MGAGGAPSGPPRDGTIRVPYGPGPLHFGDLRLPPARVSGPHTVVILIHGGFWRARFGLDLMDGLGDDLAARGIASWNVEYRRVGDPGGGWPGTLADVARAADHLPALARSHNLDLARVVTLGHSAGGHLALWLAARSRLPADAAGLFARRGDPRPVAGAVSLAGVADLMVGWRRGLGAGAVAEFLGGAPDEVLERYAAADPARLLPLGVPQVLVHGTEDDRVPIDLSREYVAAARAAGDGARLRELPGADHFVMIDPATAAWAAIVEELTALLARVGAPPSHPDPGGEHEGTGRGGWQPS